MSIKIKVKEYRTLPNDEKGLEEQRVDLMNEMEGIINKSKEETRTLSEEETKRFGEIRTEVEAIDGTLKAIEEQRTLEDKKPAKKKKKKEERTQDQIDNEELRTIFEQRSAMNTKVSGDGGAVINESLSKEIIKELKDRSAVYSFFNSTTIKGNFKVPKKASSGTATWEDEQTTPNPTSKSTTPTLTLLELGQHRLYRESALTQQMLNVQELDLKSFVIDDISETMIDAIEDAIFNGDGNKKPAGIISGITKKVTLETRGTITVDDFKRVKAKLKKKAQKGAKWFMNSETLLEVDLLKDANGQYILKEDVTADNTYKILGLEVEVTDAMPTLETTGESCVVVLANPKAYHTNTQKAMALSVYDDSTYKRAGLVGYGADIYLDGKVKNDDVVSGIFNPAA